MAGDLIRERVGKKLEMLFWLSRLILERTRCPKDGMLKQLISSTNVCKGKHLADSDPMVMLR